MDKTTVEYFIPIQSAEYVAEVNLVRIPRGSFITKEQSDLLYEIAKIPLSDWIANNCIGCVYENIDDEVKIEVEYMPEDK